MLGGTNHLNISHVRRSNFPDSGAAHIVGRRFTASAACQQGLITPCNALVAAERLFGRNSCRRSACIGFSIKRGTVARRRLLDDIIWASFELWKRNRRE